MIDTVLFRHQEAVINSIRYHPQVPYIFLIGGFGAGKSFTDVQLCLFLYHAYKNSKEPINIGLLGVTIKLLKQTVIADLERAFDRGGIVYKDNSQAGTITVGPITFIYLSMQNPDDIYAFNFHCAICDEIDEVPPERVKKITTAIQERCRKVMPAGKNLPSREPFICFTTTAQGLGGTYHLVKYFQKEKVPYLKIRARTQDNTTLAPSQLKLLRKLYTEDEARAYLDGEFVNLTTGRVYPMFNTAKHRYMPFAVRDTDTIYVGQDFNKGFNAAVIIIERAGIMYVVKTCHWTFVGNAASELRKMYPNNRIIMIPDASGKEIMSGFIEEFEEHNVEIFWNNKNPSVTERITAINKAFMFNQLYIFEGCDQLLMGLETRDFDDNSGEPRKGKGPEALDHHCDALEYAVWRIIWSIKGYTKILDAIRAVHHTKHAAEKAEYEYLKEQLGKGDVA